MPPVAWFPVMRARYAIMEAEAVMVYSVLLVDGPNRGETIAIDDPNRSDWFVPISPKLDVFAYAYVTPEEMDPYRIEPTLQSAHYKITRLRMFGQWLLVGSVSERPSDYDLFLALASDRAKAAVIS